MAPIRLYQDEAERHRAFRQRHGQPRQRCSQTPAQRQRAYRQRQKHAEQGHLKVYYRSITGEWATPQRFFDALDAEFHFTMDLAASPTNAKCARYFTQTDDALTQPWEGICWLNPPYGRELGVWLQKAYESAQAGATIVCLLPARTDRRWWHTYALHGEVRFVPGRLTFEGAENPAPFASVVVIFRPPPESPSR